MKYRVVATILVVSVAAALFFVSYQPAGTESPAVAAPSTKPAVGLNF